MKKLLAILLILMLPICAIADTRELTIRVETNEIPFQQVLRDAFKSVPTLTDGGTAVYVQLIHHVLNGLEVNIKSQKDAFQLTTALKRAFPLGILNLHKNWHSRTHNCGYAFCCFFGYIWNSPMQL